MSMCDRYVGDQLFIPLSQARATVLAPPLFCPTTVSALSPSRLNTNATQSHQSQRPRSTLSTLAAIRITVSTQSQTIVGPFHC